MPLKGAEAVIVGRSNIVGKPMAMLLLAQSCTVTVCHSQSKDLAFHTRRADILVAAVGRAKMITGDMIKPGATVIDVGINRLRRNRASSAATSISNRPRKSPASSPRCPAASGR